MRSLPLVATAFAFLACQPQQLVAGGISFKDENIVVVMDVPSDSRACPVLDTKLIATVNGVAASFSDRGGGKCEEIEVTGGSLLTLAPSSGPPPKKWSCICRPAKLELPSPTGALVVKICSGQDCSTASWPAAGPMPTAELARPVIDGQPLVVNFTPALPAAELSSLVSLSRLQGPGISPEGVVWADGSATVPNVANSGGLEAVIVRSETLEPVECDGFNFCSEKRVFQRTAFELVP